MWYYISKGILTLLAAYCMLKGEWTAASALLLLSIGIMLEEKL